MVQGSLWPNPPVIYVFLDLFCMLTGDDSILSSLRAQRRTASATAGGCSVIFNYAHKPDHCSQRRGRLRDKARGSIGEDQECDAPLPHVLGDDYNPSRYLDCLKSARREQETLQI